MIQISEITWNTSKRSSKHGIDRRDIQSWISSDDYKWENSKVERNHIIVQFNIVS